MTQLSQTADSRYRWRLNNSALARRDGTIAVVGDCSRLLVFVLYIGSDRWIRGCDRVRASYHGGAMAAEP